MFLEVQHIRCSDNTADVNKAPNYSAIVILHYLGMGDNTMTRQSNNTDATSDRNNSKAVIINEGRKRMLAEKVIGQNAFLDLKPSARALYLYLYVCCTDNDGIIEGIKRHVRYCGASPQDLQRLIAAGYLLTFDDEPNFAVITHWFTQNYNVNFLRKNRHFYSNYFQILEKLFVNNDDKKYEKFSNFNNKKCLDFLKSSFGDDPRTTKNDDVNVAIDVAIESPQSRHDGGYKNKNKNKNNNMIDYLINKEIYRESSENEKIPSFSEVTVASDETTKTDESLKRDDYSQKGERSVPRDHKSLKEGDSNINQVSDIDEDEKTAYPPISEHRSGGTRTYREPTMKDSPVLYERAIDDTYTDDNDFKKFLEEYPDKHYSDWTLTAKWFFKRFDKKSDLPKLYENLEIQKKSIQWHKENGKYIPQDLNYLKARNYSIYTNFKQWQPYDPAAEVTENSSASDGMLSDETVLDPTVEQAKKMRKQKQKSNPSVGNNTAWTDEQKQISNNQAEEQQKRRAQYMAKQKQMQTSDQEASDHE